MADKKFSDFTATDPATLESAGAVIPAAVGASSNNKFSFAQLKTWIKSWMLGETSALAYRGDRGKIAYDHSQTTGNPHGATASDVGAAALLHGDQHGYGESDQISVDTHQISNMSAFGRSLVDDASAADARTTLDAAQSTATLTDSASSTTLPTAGTATALGTLLQQIRNNLKGIVGDFVSKTATSLQTVVSGVLFKGGVFSERATVSSTTNAFESKVTGDTRNRFEMRADGTMFWGDGTSGTFEIFYRSALGILRTNSNFQALSLDKNGGSDTTALAGNVQTQLNSKVSKTGDETIAGSKTFSAVPTVPNQSAESVGAGAANAQFVADKVYPGNEGSFITASGSIALVHAEMRVVNANNITITLTNTPALGTVSWLYYTPVSCSTGSLTLSFNDPIGVSRTYSKTATAGSSHLPQWIKCTRCLQGWSVQWETEA